LAYTPEGLVYYEMSPQGDVVRTVKPDYPVV
jgi:hypothetical protein